MRAELQESETTVLLGKVRWFSSVKGYGFIIPPRGPDIFVHQCAIHGEGFRALRGGQTVAFAVVEGPRGPQAAQVMRVRAPA